MLFILLGFAVSVIVVIVSGSRLSRYGDAIAAQSGMGKAWFGLILMAAVTSLPELFTGISSIVVVNSPDIAVGNVTGSCAFNLFILVILDAVIKKKSIYALVAKSHVLACFISIVLITVFVIANLFGTAIPLIGWYSSASILLIALYLLAVFIIFKNEEKRVSSDPVNIKITTESITFNRAVNRYILFAAIVVIGSIALPYFADNLAEKTGLSKSFIGTLLVAAATSLPELTVSLEAIRLKSMDIALGNLLGSNIFNIFILSIEDALYTKGSLFAAVNHDHAFSGLIAVIMTAVVGVGILQYDVPKRLALSTTSVIILLLYLSLMIILYNR